MKARELKPNMKNMKKKLKLRLKTYQSILRMLIKFLESRE